MKRFNFFLALILLVLITGCVARAVREKQEQLCADLRTLKTAIAVFKKVGTTGTSTVATLKESEERVSQAFETLKASVVRDQEAAVKDLEKAYENLDESVKELPDQLTMAQAMTFIGDKVTTLESALGKTKSGLQCPSTLSDSVESDSFRMWRR
jgi:hypothetical protein